jgi:hypothetical protein
MGPADATNIFEAVQDFLWEGDVRGSKVAGDAGLLATCYQAAGEPPDVVDVDLRMVAVMCLLGPDQHDAPPQNQRDILLDRIQLPPTAADAPAVGERIVEYVAAWGCGQARAAAGPPGSWQAIWAEARRYLCEYLGVAVEFADKWLEVRVVGLQNMCGPPPYFPGAEEQMADWMTCDAAAIPFASGQIMEFQVLEDETEYMMSSQFLPLCPVGQSASFRTGPTGLKLPSRRVAPLT